jgi:hypothetical protein
MSGHGRNRCPPAIDLDAVEQRTALQGNAPYLNSFEIDDHFSVYGLLLFNDGAAPEACRSFAS